MAENSAIEWTDHTFNPWWGCTRVSPACTHCYAATLAKRFGYGWGKNADRRFFGDKHWAEPLRWDRAAENAGERKRVFCASMADVFEDRADLWNAQERLWDLIEATPHLDWLLLTKRPENILRMVPTCWRDPQCHDGWPPNVWVGTTVEDQERADERIPHLQAVPAPVRFLSCEPLLGPIDLNLEGIGWVIAGGESGHGARPMHPDWVESIRDQCHLCAPEPCPTCEGDRSVEVEPGGFAACPTCSEAQGDPTGRRQVPFLFKQWGEWAPAPWKLRRDRGESLDAYKARSEAEAATHAMSPGGHLSELQHQPWSIERTSGHPAIGLRRVGKKAAGRMLDRRTWDEVPS